MIASKVLEALCKNVAVDTWKLDFIAEVYEELRILHDVKMGYTLKSKYVDQIEMSCPNGKEIKVSIKSGILIFTYTGMRGGIEIPDADNGRDIITRHLIQAGRAKL